MKYLGSYVKGAFCPPKRPLRELQSSQWKKHLSPADFEDQIFQWPEKNLKLPEETFEIGKKAFLPWTRLSLLERAQKLQPLKTLLKKNFKELAQILSRETGKPLWESEGEVKALLGKTDFVLNSNLKRIQTQRIPQAQGQIRFKSRGLLLVIGPFNFPLHLPFGQILPALLSGNTLIFKPSEKTPACGQKLAELFDQLQLPPGVFQMIQGGPQISKKLCQHPEIDGIFFTGSFKVGQKIKEALVKEPSKILALEMGGLNSALIWDYKDKKQALDETLKGCFWTAGQRCSSTSQILIHKKLFSDFAPAFVSAAKKIKVDHWSKGPFMGPLIDSSSVKRFFSLQEEVIKQGGEVLLKGEKLKHKKGYYVTPGIYKMNPNQKSHLKTEEFFTPQVLIYEMDSLDQAIELINFSGYGLVLSLFTKEKTIQEEAFYRAKVALIHYNLSSVGASSWLPFGGLGKSGNDRPGGAFMIDSCVSPLAERGKEGF